MRRCRGDVERVSLLLGPNQGGDRMALVALACDPSLRRLALGTRAAVGAQDPSRPDGSARYQADGRARLGGGGGLLSRRLRGHCTPVLLARLLSFVCAPAQSERASEREPRTIINLSFTRCVIVSVIARSPQLQARRTTWLNSGGWKAAFLPIFSPARSLAASRWPTAMFSQQHLVAINSYISSRLRAEPPQTRCSHILIN